ncbi:MAG TPA: PAC2 family protein [Acidimicrobiales bacterium]|jgi:predicted ATP-grasp superfamily ATP-dependent carboligase|nr:PAC2 family protein [Acidimicrobiales bacterium]
MEHVAWSRRPELATPTVIAAFTGWNDAGDAASLAVRHLIDQWSARAFASIDPEEFFDFQTTRPEVRLADGVTREILWPGNDLFSASTPGGDVVLLLGTEPQLKWRTFTRQVTDVAREIGAGLVVTLGALLADVIHHRPVHLIGTASDSDVIERFSLQRSRYEGPTGIVGVLHDACVRSDLASVSLWAAVPAYASQVTSPKAAATLAEGACDLIGATFVSGLLGQAVVDYERHVERMVAADPDLVEYVRRLEAMSDEDDDEDDDDSSTAGELSAEGLMDDIERFLRDQGG